MKRNILTCLLAMMYLLTMLSSCGGTSESITETASPETNIQSVGDTESQIVELEMDSEMESAMEAVSTMPDSDVMEDVEYLVEFPLEEEFFISVSMSTTPSLTGSALIADDGSELGWARWLEERTGATVEVDLYSFLDSSDKQNLMIASGDYTDVIVGSLNYPGGIDGAVEEEVLTDISEYADYMPDYMNALFQNPDNVALAYSTEFHLTAFYGINDPEAKAEYGPVIRLDWLEELGLESPVTYDEWYEMLTAFKENYGATLWLTAYGGVPGDLSGGYGIMEYCGGAGFPTWVEDGAFKFSPNEDEFKDYIKMLHQWYDEGLIYPDFLSQGGNDYPDSTLINNGEIGVWFTYVSYLEAEQSQLTASDANGTIAPLAWPIKDADSINLETYGKAPNNAGVDGQGAFAITTASDDVPLLCAIFNEFYTDDGYDFCNWGIEGETYVKNNDGSHSFTELITNDEYSLGANIMMTYYFFKDGPFQYDNDRYLASYSDIQLEACELWTTGTVNISASTMTTDQASEYFTLQMDISTVYQEYFVKFITGDKDIDADWQEFMDQLDGCGLSRFMELGQLGIDQYEERYADVEILYNEYMSS